VKITNEVVRPFLPTKDMDVSRAFYEALGCEKLLDGEVVIFGVGGTSFILQRGYNQTWAENTMMQLMVDDLDAWWKFLEGLRLAKRRSRRGCSPGDCAWRLCTIRAACCGTCANGGRGTWRIDISGKPRGLAGLGLRY
jgi:hypothetical protein